MTSISAINGSVFPSMLPSIDLKKDVEMEEIYNPEQLDNPNAEELDNDHAEQVGNDGEQVGNDNPAELSNLNEELERVNDAQLDQILQNLSEEETASLGAIQNEMRTFVGSLLTDDDTDPGAVSTGRSVLMNIFGPLPVVGHLINIPFQLANNRYYDLIKRIRSASESPALAPVPAAQVAFAAPNFVPDRRIKRMFLEKMGLIQLSRQVIEERNAARSQLNDVLNELNETKIREESIIVGRKVATGNENQAKVGQNKAMNTLDVAKRELVEARRARDEATHKTEQENLNLRQQLEIAKEQQINAKQEATSAQERYRKLEIENKQQRNEMDQLKQNNQILISQRKEYQQEMEVFKSLYASLEQKFNQKLQEQEERYNQRLQEQEKENSAFRTQIASLEEQYHALQDINVTQLQELKDAEAAAKAAAIEVEYVDIQPSASSSK